MPYPPISHHRVLKIALPIVISNTTVPILGAVDTGVVGQLGPAAPIGAIGLGAVVLTSIYWIFGFLRMGTAGLTAQAKGAEQGDEVAALLSRSLLIGFAGGVLLIALQVPLFGVAFQLSPATAEVETLARTYLSIRILSAPAAIAIYGITGWLIAQERTRGVLLMQLWMNGLNIALDVLFVLHFQFGVTGVAVATFLAEYSGLALGLWLCRDVFAGSAWNNLSRIFDIERLKHMALVNRDIMIRSIFIQAALVSFLFYGAAFGDVTLAANQILLQFIHINAYALDGFASAAETLVGQAYGAANRMNLRRSAALTFFWATVSAAVLSAIFAVFGESIIDLMSVDPELRALTRDYLIYMIIAPFAGVAAFIFDGIFIGATRARDMRNTMITSFGVFMLIIWALLPRLENHGLWISLLIFFVVRGVALGLRYPSLEKSADPS